METYGLRWGILRRFVRVVGAAFVTGGVPGAVVAIQSPEVYELGTQLLGAAGVAVAAGALAALDKSVRARFGSWSRVFTAGQAVLAARRRDS